MLLVQRFAKTKGLRTTSPTVAENMGQEIISFKGWGKMNFPRVGKMNISNLATVSKFHFLHLKPKNNCFLQKQMVGKYQISKLKEKGPSYHPLPGQWLVH